MKSTIRVLAWPKDKNKLSNPYNFILYGAMSSNVIVDEFHHRSMRVSGQNIFHLHWPDLLLRDKRWWRAVYRFSRLLRAIKKFKQQGGKVVWTVHNLQPHSLRFPQLAEYFMEKFIKNVDGFLFLSQYSRDCFLEKYPQFESTPWAVTPHVHYQAYYGVADLFDDSKKSMTSNDTSDENSKKYTKPTILMFGKIRDHKGLDALVEAKSQLPEGSCQLSIVGDLGKYQLDQDILKYIDRDANITTTFEYIHDRDIPKYFSKSSAVILPYTDILNSGTAVLALSFNVPIIAPKIGSLISLRDEFGDDWVYLYDQPLNAEKLAASLEWLKQRRSGTINLASLKPAKIAEQTEDFYRILIDR
ncbi:glycosyltransferase [Sessilibacter sp. MAH4]